MGFGGISNKIEPMSGLYSQVNNVKISYRVLTILLCISIGLILGFVQSVFASSFVNLDAAPGFEQIWPSVGVGAGYMRFDHLNIQEGLSDNNVLAILQDSSGFLWFGTREGLNKFDGYDFISFKADFKDPDSLSDSHITALAETADGSLWIGTHDAGLNLYNPAGDNFLHYTPNADDPTALQDPQINVLLVDSQDTLWIGTQSGLSRYVSDEAGFVNFQHDPDDMQSLSNDRVLSLFEDGKGRLWVGTENGLNLLDREKGTVTRFLTGISSGVSHVSSLSSDGEGNLWFGSLGGLIHFDTENGTYQVFRHQPNDPGSLSSNRITCLLRDQSGGLWVGYEDQGIDLITGFSSEELEMVSFEHQAHNPQSLSNNAIHTIFQDQGGLLWFGTQGTGVDKANLATRDFGTYQHAPGNPNSPAGENITALAVDAARQSLWIGTAGYGLDRMNLVTGEFVHFQHDPEDPHSLDHDFVSLLHIGPQGTLYVETQEGVLEYYDSTVESFLPAFPNLTGIHKGVDTTAIAHDEDGTLWLSLSSGYLIRVDPAGEATIRYDLESNAPESLQNVKIVDIHVDSPGVLWLATADRGLVQLDLQEGEVSVLAVEDDQNGPSHRHLTNIHQSRDGVLWLGTEGGGLNRFDPSSGEFFYYTTQEGLPSNRVFGIVEDSQGYLWLSTGNGLVRFDPVTETIQTFNASDGLQGDSFNPNAFAVDYQGVLFFGGVNGFNAFNPSLIRQNNHVPPMVITEVSLFNKVLARDITGCSASLSLAYDQNFLSFDFSALDFTAPENNAYAYMMEGLDTGFIQAGGKRSADYPNLPSGKYTFRLIGANNDGVWNTAETCLLIEIQKPFWATWWFILLVGLLLAGGVVFGYQWRVRYIEKTRQNLAVEVFERTMEIERRRQMASGLSEVIRLLNTNQPLEKSLDFIVQQSVGLTSASKAAIFERDGDLIYIRACYPEGETRPVDLSNPISSSARILLETTFNNRLLIYSRLDPKTMKSETTWELVSGEYRTILCTPLVVAQEVYGGLVLYYGEDRTFTPEEITLANTLTDQASLAIANDRLKSEVQKAAVIAERNRLARDLHDAVTQTLFSTSLIAEVLPRIWEKNPEQGQHRLKELQQLTRGALGEMRTLLMELRPSALQEADERELFQHLLDAFSGRTGVPTDFYSEGLGNCDLSEDVKLVFYRIAQEGLHNIAKHADATHVIFNFICLPASATLTITDDGKGFDEGGVSAGHLGLAIMKERAESIGADLTLVSLPSEGTTLRLVWQAPQDTIK